MGNSSLPAAMLTELQGQARVHFTMDLTLDGTTYKFAKYPIVSEANGEYYPYVESFGSIKKTLGFPAFGIQNVRSTVNIFDYDRTLQKKIGGSAGGKIVGATCNIVLRSFHVAEASHYTVLPGIVKDWRITGDQKFQFVIGVDETPLRTPFKIPRKTREIFPNIDESVEDEDGAIYFGNHFSSGITGATGMVEAKLIDTAKNYWYVSYGTVTDVTNIHVDGVSDTDWTVIGTQVAGGPDPTSFFNGRPYTIIEDTASTKRTAENTVTCDVEGPERQGDGSGDTTTETDPVILLRIILCNFVYNDYPIGATKPNPGGWAFFGQSVSDANTPYNDTINSVLEMEGATMSAKITSSMTPLTFLKDWAETFGVWLGWDTNLEIVLADMHFFDRDIQVSDVIENEKVQKISMTTLSNDIITKLETNYLFNHAQNQYELTTGMDDAMTPEIEEETLNYKYGKSEVD